MSSFQKIGVVGAGMMGSEIALMFPLAAYAGRGSHRYDSGGNGQ